jgi:hypothetical protein
MTAHNVPGKLRKLVFAAGIALSLSAFVAASVIVEASPASASTRFVDHGGRVLSAAHVYLIYWGRYWAPDRVASPTPDQITPRTLDRPGRVLPGWADAIPRHRTRRYSRITGHHHDRPAEPIHRQGHRGVP